MNQKHDKRLANLGERINRRRRELGLTQKQLAKRIKKSPSYVSSVECGKSVPTLQTLYIISEALDMEYIIDGDGRQ